MSCVNPDETKLMQAVTQELKESINSTLDYDLTEEGKRKRRQSKGKKAQKKNMYDGSEDLEDESHNDSDSHRGGK